LIDLGNIAQIESLPGVLLAPDDRDPRGFYVFPRSPRIALTDDGKQQVSLSILGRREGTDFRADRGLFTCTTSLALADEELERVVAELRRWIAERSGVALEDAPRPLLMSAHWHDARVALAVTDALTLTSRPSMFGENQCVFMHNATAAEAVSLQEAWTEGLPGASITYELELRPAGTGADRDALTLSGPLKLSEEARSGAIRTVDLGDFGTRRQNESTTLTEGTEEQRMGVSIVVDYSNGVIKSYSGVALGAGRADHSVLAVLGAAGSAGPGIDVEVAFASDFTDRGGREVGGITSVDGLPGADSDKGWQLFVNGRRITEHREPMPDNPAQDGVPSINDGDHICLMLVSPESD